MVPRSRHYTIRNGSAPDGTGQTEIGVSNPPGSGRRVQGESALSLQELANSGHRGAFPTSGFTLGFTPSAFARFALPPLGGGRYLPESALSMFLIISGQIWLSICAIIRISLTFGVSTTIRTKHPRRPGTEPNSATVFTFQSKPLGRVENILGPAIPLPMVRATKSG